VLEPPPGLGRTIVLLHGFGVPPQTLAPLARWLRSGGWTTRHPALGWNVGCGTDAVEAVRTLVRTERERSSDEIVLLGHSRGGVIARVAAVQEPASIARVVTVCTPWMVGPPDRPGVGLGTAVVRLARSHGLGGFGSIACATGDCCRTFRVDLERKPEASWTALWSSRDRVAGAMSAPPLHADAAVDLRTTHLGSVLSATAWTAIGSALATNPRRGTATA
jgi:triacylglycerol lipase